MQPESRTELSQVITTAWPVTRVIEKPQGCDVIHRQITDKYTHKYTIITEQGPGQTDKHIIMNMVNLWSVWWSGLIKRSRRVNIVPDQTNIRFRSLTSMNHDGRCLLLTYLLFPCLASCAKTHVNISPKIKVIAISATCIKKLLF